MSPIDQWGIPSRWIELKPRPSPNSPVSWSVVCRGYHPPAMSSGKTELSSKMTYKDLRSSKSGCSSLGPYFDDQRIDGGSQYPSTFEAERALSRLCGICKRWCEQKYFQTYHEPKQPSLGRCWTCWTCWTKTVTWWVSRNKGRPGCRTIEQSLPSAPYIKMTSQHHPKAVWTN